jgi:proliferating cell nuclear antigen
MPETVLLDPTAIAKKEFLDNNILTMQTIQISPFRTLIAALKDILVETDIVFSPSGIKITSMDKTQNILVHLSLDAKKFEVFECKREKIIVTLNMFHLYRVINSIDGNDTLTIYIMKEDYNEGLVTYLSFNFENDNIKQSNVQKLKMLDTDTDEVVYPDVTFSTIINLPTTDFQKIIRDLASLLCDKVTIKSVGGELIFTCVGAFASSKLTRSESDGHLAFQTGSNQGKITCGEFAIANLTHFIKCTNLCSQLEMYLENDLPLVVKYNVADLGNVKLCVSQCPVKGNQ